MGIFDSIKNVFVGALTGSSLKKAVDVSFPEAKGKVMASPVPFAPAVGGVISFAQKTAKTIATYPKTSIVAGIGSLIGYGAVKENPAKAVETTAKLTEKTTKGFVNVGSNLVQFGGDPSFETAFDIVEENPVIVGSVVAGGALATGKYVYPAVASFLNLRGTEAIRENTKALGSSGGSGGSIGNELDYGDQKNLIQETQQQERKTLEENYEGQIQLVKAQSKANIELAQLQFKQQKEFLTLQTPAVAPSQEVVAPLVKKKTKKKAKKKTKKKKKKTRRSKKKSKKKKKKSINRRKN